MCYIKCIIIVAVTFTFMHLADAFTKVTYSAFRLYIFVLFLLLLLKLFYHSQKSFYFILLFKYIPAMFMKAIILYLLIKTKIIWTG